MDQDCQVLVLHLITNHTEGDNWSYVCPYTSETFITKRTLSKHLQRVTQYHALKYEEDL
jgi:hypothetical protein